MTGALLEAKGLSIAYAGGLPVVQNISFAIMPGECVALVGPSGSGKSTIARAILGMLPSGSRAQGQLDMDGIDLLTCGEAGFRALRGRTIGYVAQDPYLACDPLRTVQEHVSDAWYAHGLAVPPGRVVETLDSAGIVDAGRAAQQHPHQWSGGMLQRASIAAATAHHPPLLIADEPTSALDADRADATLAMLKGRGSAILLISHDLELVMRHADRVLLCDGGTVIGSGTPAELAASDDPAIQRLIAASAVPTRRRCDGEGAPVLSIANLGRRFGRGVHERSILDGVDLTVRSGEVIGVTGPSGCGKSTLLRIIAGQDGASSGDISRADQRPGAMMQVFQDPVASLDARWPIWRSITEPLTAPHMPRLNRAERRARAQQALSRLGLAHLDLDSVPGELSSGQCQRISVARALIANPGLLLADEPTSALDTLAKRQVLDMLVAAADAGTAVLLVSHDRSMLAALCDRVLEFHDGKLRPSAG